MISDQNFLSTLRFPLILLFSCPKLLLDGALLANVQPRVNSIIDFHSAINQLEPTIPNYCNESKLIEQSGLIRAPMGQFLGFPCSNEFYHCRWQSDGYRTHKKNCRAGLVYDVLGTQNCNYDYNVKGCAMGPSGGGVTNCTSKDLFECPLSEDCVPLSKRCDGNYDCVLEEDEQNCPMCKPTHFPCVVSEQCIPLGQRCNGIKECQDGTDELECENCGAGKFLCRKSGKCIGAKERCDGFAHCPHGEDEQLCKKARIVLGPRMFICESGKHQIPQQNVCDGVVHCPDDASDEKYCQVGTATEAMRPMGARTMPSPNIPPNQLATPAIQTSKIAFDQPIIGQQQQMQQMNADGKREPWVGTSEAMGRHQQRTSSLIVTNQPNSIGHVGGEALPIQKLGPMRNVMMNIKMPKIDSNGTNRLMVEMPRERRPKIEQEQTEDRAKTLVEGDFQAGVWNGSSLQQQQQNNPYAEEWYRQRQNGEGAIDGRDFGQKIEQNNLVQEENDQFRWSKLGGQLPQPQPVVIARQQQFEQRRAIKENEAEETAGGEGTKSGGGETEITAEPKGTAHPKAMAEGGGEKQTTMEDGDAVKSAAKEHGEWTTEVPTNNDELAKQWKGEKQFTVGIGDDQLKKSTDTKINGEGTAENDKPETVEVGNCGEKAVGREGTGGESVGGAMEQQQEQKVQLDKEEEEVVTTLEQQQQTENVQEERRTKTEQYGRTTTTTTPGEDNSAEEEQQLNTQITALKGEDGGSEVGQERTALNMGKDISEEQEQRAILRRLYSKYGSNARDLLQRVENLLLLAQDGILSAKKSANEPNESSGKSQKMKRRQAEAEEDKALIKRYLERIIMENDRKNQTEKNV